MAQPDSEREGRSCRSDQRASATPRSIAEKATPAAARQLDRSQSLRSRGSEPVTSVNSQHTERPHPAATASDLPAARGGKFDNPIDILVRGRNSRPTFTSRPFGTGRNSAYFGFARAAKCSRQTVLALKRQFLAYILLAGNNRALTASTMIVISPPVSCKLPVSKTSSKAKRWLGISR